VLALLPRDVLGAGSLQVAPCGASWDAVWLATCVFASRPRTVVAVALALTLPACEVVEAGLLPLGVLGAGSSPPVESDVALPSAAAAFASVALEPELALAAGGGPEDPAGIVAPTVEAGAWGAVCG
jgi:hypothetical protein